jgi:hypothetical protein
MTYTFWPQSRVLRSMPDTCLLWLQSHLKMDQIQPLSACTKYRPIWICTSGLGAGFEPASSVSNDTCATIWANPLKIMVQLHRISSGSEVGACEHMNIKLAQCVFFPCLTYHKLYIYVFSQCHDAPTQGIKPSTIRWIFLRLNFSYLQAYPRKHRPNISSTYDVHLLTAKSCTQVNARHMCAVTTVTPQDGSNLTLTLMGIKPMTTDLTVTPLTNWGTPVLVPIGLESIEQCRMSTFRVVPWRATLKTTSV